MVMNHPQAGAKAWPYAFLARLQVRRELREAERVEDALSGHAALAAINTSHRMRAEWSG